MENQIAYENAKRRVKKLKGFYNHVFVYIIINLIILGIKLYFYEDISQATWNDEWMFWNFFSTPIIWGVFLVVHGLRVFSHSRVSKWEEKKIQKILTEENKKIKR